MMCLMIQSCGILTKKIECSYPEIDHPICDELIEIHGIQKFSDGRVLMPALTYKNLAKNDDILKDCINQYYKTVEIINKKALEK